MTGERTADEVTTRVEVASVHVLGPASTAGSPAGGTPPNAGGSAVMTRVIKSPIEALAVGELDLRFAELRLFCPKRLERLKASVKREGIRQPLLAATEVETGRCVVIDGFKRVRVARELGIKHLSVSLLALDGPAALAMMVRANVAQHGMSALEEGWVVRRLCREHGLTQVKAGEALEREQSWVSHRLRLVEHLEEQLQKDLKLGLITPSVARELGRLPRAEQMRTADVVREQGLLSRQAARLVRCLLATGDPAARRAILADPGRSIAAGAPTTPARTVDSRLTAGANQLRQSLLWFEGAASRLGSRLLSHGERDLGGEAARILAPLLSQARAAGNRTLALLNKVGGPRRKAWDEPSQMPSAPAQGGADA
jgi:ParB/RepB/Spo0J family partition protein